MTLTRSLRSNSALFVVLSARAVTLLSISQQFSLIAALESILSLTELTLSPRSCSFWPIELIMLWSLVLRASPFSSKVLIYMQDIVKPILFLTICSLRLRTFEYTMSFFWLLLLCILKDFLICLSLVIYCSISSHFISFFSSKKLLEILDWSDR